jgi:hypothetical protein
MPSPTVFNASTSQWVHGAAIANPTGGTPIDAESRTAINSILSALRAAGVIAGATQLPVGHAYNGTTGQIVLTGAIAAPSGGATVDAESRTAIGSILTALRNGGVIAGGTADPSITALAYDEDTSAWAVRPAIADVSGGATVDANGRTAINSALAAMRGRQLIAQD